MCNGLYELVLCGYGVNMKIIVNADDAGIHPAVNRAVELLAEAGIVTSTSIVATGEHVEEAAKLQGVSIGVHLDILRGRPISHWQHIASVVDENGSFLCEPVKLFERYAAGKIDHMHVEQEWAAQIERVLDLGIKPTHLSSHKHVHAWPSLTRMAGMLAERYDIPWLRKPEECAEISRLHVQGLKNKFSNICSMFDREATPVQIPDYFWQPELEEKLGPDMFMEALQKADLVADSVLELCCTPGLIIAGDPIIPQYCNPLEISANWRTDYDSLSNDDWRSAFAKASLEQIAYDGK